MRRSSLLPRLLLLLAASLPRAAAAEAVPARPAQPSVLLEDDRALARWLAAAHPELAAARAEVAGARAAVGVSRALPNPALGLSVSGIGLGPRNPPSLSPSETRAYSVGLAETIELGKRGPRARAAELRRDAAVLSYDDALVTHVEDARDALARVVYFGARQRILDERLEAAREVIELEQARLDHGDISGIDHDRLVLDTMTLEREAVDNRADYEAALSNCSVALAATCEPDGVDMAAVDRAAPVPSMPPDAASAVAKRPDVRALERAGEAARQDAKLWRRQAIPDPTVGVAYTRDYLTANGNQPHTLSVSLSIPLPIFDHGGYQAAQADEQARSFELSARARLARARADVASLVRRREILERKLAGLVEKSVPHSTAVLEATEQAYHHGQLSMTDLLLVRREHVAVLLDVTDTRFELFTIRNQLRRALGLDAAELQPSQP
ncbi:MAG: TolC family protein [Sorangiineae bacterium]|nr:TolC family protein [Polyangiaceae bacterium]MEB2322942.1 TolC family protein [Sorangiineae bacterium]